MLQSVNIYVLFCEYAAKQPMIKNYLGYFVVIFCAFDSLDNLSNIRFSSFDLFKRLRWIERQDHVSSIIIL